MLRSGMPVIRGNTMDDTTRKKRTLISNRYLIMLALIICPTLFVLKQRNGELHAIRPQNMRPSVSCIVRRQDYPDGAIVSVTPKSEIERFWLPDTAKTFVRNPSGGRSRSYRGAYKVSAEEGPGMSWLIRDFREDQLEFVVYFRPNTEAVAVGRAPSADSVSIQVMALKR